MTVLDEILATKRDEVTMLHRPQVRDLLRARALEAPPHATSPGRCDPTSGTLGVVAEIKRRSPSKGDLAPDLDPALTAKAYAAGGASCLSVLTDGPWFGGAVDDLLAARAACELPVLRKDFTIDEIQVYETRAIGADAILLIVAALPDDAVLRDLHDLAVGLGLAVLVETHDDAELERALALGAHIVGRERAQPRHVRGGSRGGRAARRAVPADAVAIAESAIRSVDDATRMAAAGFDAVLVGEMLVKASDPTMTVRGLASVVRSIRPG